MRMFKDVSLNSCPINLSLLMSYVPQTFKVTVIKSVIKKKLILMKESQPIINL